MPRPALPRPLPADDRRAMSANPRLWSRIAAAPHVDDIHLTGAEAALHLLTICRMHSAQRAANAGLPRLAADHVRVGLALDEQRRAVSRRLAGGAA